MFIIPFFRRLDMRFAVGRKFFYCIAPFPIGFLGNTPQRKGRFLMAATLLDCLPCEPFLATYSHGLFRPVGQSAPELFEKLLRLGVTQHYGLCAGEFLPELKDLAMMLDMDYQRV